MLNLNRLILSTYQSQLYKDIGKAEVIMPGPRLEDLGIPNNSSGPFVTYLKADTRDDEKYNFHSLILVSIFALIYLVNSLHQSDKLIGLYMDQQINTFSILVA